MLKYWFIAICYQQLLVHTGMFRGKGEFLDSLTPGGMKRSGFRSCYVSTETDLATSYNAHITNAPALFYDRLLGGVNHSFLTKLIVPFTNPFLSPSDDINKSPFS